MKKLVYLFIIAALLLAACNKNENRSNEENNTTTVYTTVYPLQFFAEKIGGDTVTVTSIYPPGSDEHTFDPTQKDMMALADSDLFLYVGLGLEGFVSSAEKTLKNEKVKLVPVAESIDTSKLAEGHSHEDEHEHDSNQDEHGQFDPHVWISPVLSIDLAKTIKEALIEEAPEHKQLYEDNFKLLENELQQLDTDFKTMAEAAPMKTFFVSHASFGYIAEAYGLEQIAIAGLNSQSEPSQKQLATLVKQAKENHIKYVMYEQNVASNLTEVIQKEIGAEALMLHNLGVLTKEDIDHNEDYLTLMRHNIDSLQTALSSK